ncbi:MAG: hypothetical protein KAH04_02185 [Psychrilyobacter sp.]|nr:hypothetical protein [Psychrilyobacter sp.]
MNNKIITMKEFEEISEILNIEGFKNKVALKKILNIDELEGRVTNFDQENMGTFHETTVETYLKEISSTKAIKSERVGELLKEIKLGDEFAREELLEGILKSIARIALIYNKLGVSYMDLVQDGLIGVINGINFYDEKLNIDPLIYLELWCKYQIIQSTKTSMEELKLAIITYLKNEKVEIYKARNSGVFDEKDMEEKLGITLEEYKNLQKIDGYGFIIGETDKESLEGNKTIEEVDKEIARIEKTMLVSNIVNKFSKEEIKIIEMFYGLSGKRKYHGEIAIEFDKDIELVEEQFKNIMIKLKYNGSREWINEN